MEQVIQTDKMPTASGVIHRRESDILRYAPESLPITDVATRPRAERALDPPTCSTVAASSITAGTRTGKVEAITEHEAY